MLAGHPALAATLQVSPLPSSTIPARGRCARPTPGVPACLTRLSGPLGQRLPCACLRRPSACTMAPASSPARNSGACPLFERGTRRTRRRSSARPTQGRALVPVQLRSWGGGGAGGPAELRRSSQMCVAPPFRPCCAQVHHGHGQRAQTVSHAADWGGARAGGKEGRRWPLCMLWVPPTSPAATHLHGPLTSPGLVPARLPQDGLHD